MTSKRRTGLRVLVADTDRVFADGLEHLLRSWSFEVRRAGSGVELLDCLFTDGPFDLLCAEVLLPWMNGLHAVHTARALGLSIPAVMMSASPDPELDAMVACLGPGATLLRKPFGSLRLWSALDAVATRRAPAPDREAPRH